MNDPPGPITNSDLIKEGDFYKSNDEDDIYNKCLKENVHQRYDFKIINKKQWDFLFSKYGGVPLKREPYLPDRCSMYQVETKFEQVDLIILPPREDFDIEAIVPEKPMYISKSWTVKQLKQRIVKILNQPNYGYSLTEANFRLWKLNSNVRYEEAIKQLSTHMSTIRNAVINNTNPDVEENTSIEFPGLQLEFQEDKKLEKRLGFSYSNKIIIERANSKGEFIFKYYKNVIVDRCEYCRNEKPLMFSCSCKQVYYCSRNCLLTDIKFHESKCTAVDDDDSSEHKKTEESKMGLVGLQNLGNTCFMNSGLQCLSNTYLLSRYFLENRYKNEINETNPLGMKGALAKSYAKLIRILWYDSYSIASPSFLKRIIGKFHSAFSGYSQQDSPELITTVLDAMNEDLNRIKTKPYVGSITTDDPDDNSISDSNWYNYLARNQSIVVDLMHGQYKSVLKCPNCAKYSVAFDPFCMIPLPVSETKKRIIDFTYVPYDLSKKQIKSSVTVDKAATIDNVREKVAQELNVSKYGSIFVLLSSQTFDKFLSKAQPAKLIKKKASPKLFIQEINPEYFNGPENITNAKKLDKQPMVEELKEITKKVPSVDNDNNNGLCDDMLKVCINIYLKYRYSSLSNYNKSRQTFNRLIHLKRSHTLKDLHMEVFRYFRPLFEICAASNQDKSYGMRNMMPTINEEKLEEVKKISNEQMFESLFPGLKDENAASKTPKEPSSIDQDELIIKDSSSAADPEKFSYVIRFVNFNDHHSFSRDKCPYCNKSSCDNCIVPFTSAVTVQDMLDKISTKLVNNDYYFEEHHGYRDDNKDFQLEIVFSENQDTRKLDTEMLEQCEFIRNVKEDTKKENEITIYSCFEKFMNWEVLDQNNLWYCPNCKKSVQASKRMEIIRCPPILILHLKRFKVRDDRYMCRSGGRLNSVIRFPLTDLNLTPYVKKTDIPPLYDLYAVSNHYGNTEGGHYTAYALNKGHWYSFDDSSVTPTSEDQICSVASYVLFYKRKDIKDDNDYTALVQTIPNGYTVPIIDAKGNKLTNSAAKEEKKGHDGEARMSDSEEEKGGVKEAALDGVKAVIKLDGTEGNSNTEQNKNSGEADNEANKKPKSQMTPEEARQLSL